MVPVRILAVFLFLFSMSLYPQDQIKVACIGNSVTYGAGINDRENDSYPAQLQRLLGEKYEVKNFGKSGATLLSKGHRPYINEQEYKRALEFAGDLVVIHLGLNDTDPRNWPNYRDDILTDYLKLIESFYEKNPNCQVWICRMTPITHQHKRFISGTRDWHREIQEKIEQVSHYAPVKLIDLESPLLHRPDLLPDALHPNAEGAGIIAQTVYSALTGDYGGLKMPLIYTDQMVLPRNRYVKIEGVANRGDEVTVAIASQKHKAITGDNGNWSVQLNPLAAGNEYTLEISTSQKTLRYKNVAAGEVWLCSGQSNMAFQLAGDADFKNNSDKTINKKVRVFDMQPRWETNAVVWDSTVLEPLNKLDYFKETVWRSLDLESVGQFSAIAYYFGNMLADSLDVPIGLIHNAVGGSTQESWIDRKLLEDDFPEILANWTENDLIQEWARERALLNIKQSESTKQRHPYEPCYLFEAGILPLGQFPINGVIWYQGESNAHNMEAFERLFPLFIDSWRDYWQMSELPFYYVQLSGLNRPSWTWFRDSQRKMMEKIPWVYMAVSSDRGDSLDVHPRHKKEIGERLAFWALNKSYGKQHITPSGPLYRSVEFKEDFALLHFDYAEGMQASDGCEIIGFEIAEVDGLYYPAKAEVHDRTIKLHSSKIKKTRYVRYGWQPFTRANLVNSAGLPASTFRTEQQTIKEMKENIRCEKLPDFPIAGGVTGMMTGIEQDKLIVIGGCNFPNKAASEGGEKAFYNDVYLLDLSASHTDQIWRKCEKFPYSVAYGTAVNTPKGIVCIGGQNEQSALSEVTLVNYDESAGDLTYTPLPSLPVSIYNAAAALLEGVIFVVGGSHSDQQHGNVYCMDLHNIKEGWKEADCRLATQRQQPSLVAQAGSLFLAGGYDEERPEVFTNVLRLQSGASVWEEYSPIYPQNKELRTSIGASAVPLGDNYILFAGGVNYERFDSALKRIKRKQQALHAGDESLVAELEAAGKRYMAQPPEWYQFNRTLLAFDLRDNSWQSLGDYEALARAGAAIIRWQNNLYVIGGELKPGIRTTASHCLTID